MQTIQTGSTAFSPEGLLSHLLQGMTLPTAHKPSEKEAQILKELEKARTSDETPSLLSCLANSNKESVVYELVSVVLRGNEAGALKALDLLDPDPQTKKLLLAARTISPTYLNQNNDPEYIYVSNPDSKKILEQLSANKANGLACTALTILSISGLTDAAKALRGFKSEYLLQAVIEKIESGLQPDLLLYPNEKNRIASLPYALEGSQDLRSIDLLKRCAKQEHFYGLKLSALHALKGCPDILAQGIIAKCALKFPITSNDATWKLMYGAACTLRTLDLVKETVSLLEHFRADPKTWDISNPFHKFIRNIGLLMPSIKEATTQMRASAAIALSKREPELAREILSSLKSYNPLVQATIKLELGRIGS